MLGNFQDDRGVLRGGCWPAVVWPGSGHWATFCPPVALASEPLIPTQCWRCGLITDAGVHAVGAGVAATERPLGARRCAGVTGLGQLARSSLQSRQEERC